MTSRIVFVLGLLAALSGFVSPPLALALGLAFGLLFPHPYPKQSTKISKYLLQLAVIGLATASRDGTAAQALLSQAADFIAEQAGEFVVLDVEIDVVPVF